MEFFIQPMQTVTFNRGGAYWRALIRAFTVVTKQKCSHFLPTVFITNKDSTRRKHQYNEFLMLFFWNYSLIKNPILKFCANNSLYHGLIKQQKIDYFYFYYYQEPQVEVGEKGSLLEIIKKKTCNLIVQIYKEHIIAARFRKNGANYEKLKTVVTQSPKTQIIAILQNV